MSQSIVRKRISALASGIFLLLVALFLLNVVRDRNLNHDEHQFVASAVLLVREGLLPYRDYPYFHVPNLLFLYAFLFRFSDYYLLTARLFTVLCEWLLMLTFYVVAWHHFSEQKNSWRLVLTGCTVLLLLGNPLYLYTSGIAWNHALPVLLTVWAFLIHSRVLRAGSARRGWLFVSGLLIGGAVGTRLSFAALVLPFLWMIFLRNRDEEQDGVGKNDDREGRGKPCPYGFVFFMIGVGIALLPTLWTFLLAPEQFIFGTIEYAMLNTLYRETNNFEQAMTLTGKISYLFHEVILFERGGNLIFILIFFFFALLPKAKTIFLGEAKALPASSFLLSQNKAFELFFLWLLQPFLLLGALAPTPTQRQYMYPFVPFLVLIMVYSLPNRSHTKPRSQERGNRTTWLFVLAVILSLPTSNIPRYYNLFKLLAYHKSTPIEVHERGEQIARLTEKQKVLTLAPTIPLEGGNQIYEALATGPFAWRVSRLLPEEVRQRQGMVGDQELPALIGDEPPRAILVGIEPEEADEEVPLIEYAQTHAYTALKLADEQTLWLSSLADWGGAIRLAAVELPTKALAPGEKFQALFYLQNIAPIAPNLNILVRVIGEDGQELLRDEGWPYGSATSTWPLQEIWRDGHQLTIPQNALAGTYRVELTFYDPATFEHLPAIMPMTGEAIGERLMVGELVVGE